MDELLRALQIARSKRDKRRDAARWRWRQARAASTARFAAPELQSMPILDELPSREWLEANPLTSHPPKTSDLSREDRARIQHLVRVDAYVADYGGAALEIDYAARKEIGTDDEWLGRADIQQELRSIRAEQQQVVAAMAQQAPYGSRNQSRHRDHSRDARGRSAELAV
jgi:hypothetical protein